MLPGTYRTHVFVCLFPVTRKAISITNTQRRVVEWRVTKLGRIIS